MTQIGRSLLFLLFLSLGCVAQSASPDLMKRIERQVRFSYKIPPGVLVLVSKPTPSTEFPAFEKVVVTLDTPQTQQDLDFLISKDGQSLKQLLDFDLSKDPFVETASKIDLRGRPTRGAKASKVVVVNFDDFQCPFCARMHQILFPQILKEYGDRVTFLYKDNPLVTLHPWAMHAAVDANCLGAQNTDAYWDFADYIHVNQQEVNKEKTPEARLEMLDRVAMTQGQKHRLDSTKLQACVKAQDESAVKMSLQEGAAIGVEATPALFVNGEEIPGGAASAEVVRAALDRALKDANLPVPEHATSASVAPSK